MASKKLSKIDDWRAWIDLNPQPSDPKFALLRIKVNPY